MGAQEVYFGVMQPYQPSDRDDASDPQYFGFLKKDGSWYIQKYDVANGQFRYANGARDYTTAWTARATLTYSLFNAIPW